MSKLYIITRDGKAANDFIELNNMSKSDVIIVKETYQLMGLTSSERYVIVPPLPFNYHWSMRPILTLNHMTNVTKFYNSKQIKF